MHVAEYFSTLLLTSDQWCPENAFSMTPLYFLCFNDRFGMHEDLCFSSEQVAGDCLYFDVLFFLDFHGNQSVKESQKPKKAAGLA